MKKSYIVVIAAIFLIGAFVGAAVVYQQQQVSESKAVSSQFAERLGEQICRGYLLHCGAYQYQCGLPHEERSGQIARRETGAHKISQ